MIKKNKKIIDKNFLNKNLKNFEAKKCYFKKCNFWEVNLNSSKFIDSKIEKSVFTDSNLKDSIFENTEILNSNFTHANLTGANFKTSKLKNVNLRDAIYSKKTIWPPRFNPKKYGAIELGNFNPFHYSIKLAYKTIKSMSTKDIIQFKKKFNFKKDTKISNYLEKKIIYELTKGKGFIVVNNYFKKKNINIADKIIRRKLENNKKYKKANSSFEVDKINKSINFFDVLNYHDVFREIIQPKVVMNAFKKLMGYNFICTYYAAQCSMAGSRGQSLHLDYPYVSFSKPGEKIPIGMGSNNYLLSCGILTYLNKSDKDNYGPIVLEKSQKLRKFPTVEDVKKHKFTKIKVPKGGMVILNTLMWHAGAPNYSNKNDRSILVAHYTPEFIKLRLNIKNKTNKNVFAQDRRNNGMLNQLIS